MSDGFNVAHADDPGLTAVAYIVALSEGVRDWGDRLDPATVALAAVLARSGRAALTSDCCRQASDWLNANGGRAAQLQLSLARALADGIAQAERLSGRVATTMTRLAWSARDVEHLASVEKRQSEPRDDADRDTGRSLSERDEAEFFERRAAPCR